MMYVRRCLVVSAIVLQFSMVKCELFSQQRDTEMEFSKSQLDFFEQHVRPILVNRCLECHGPDEQSAGLRVDSRELLLRGGSSGPCVVPEAPASSLLITAIRYEDEDYQMPPDERLSDSEIAALSRWVGMGAPWPADPATESHDPMLGDQEYIATVAEQHWAFHPVESYEPPKVKRTQLVQSPVDAFVLRKLEDAQLEPAPRADKRTLIRRIKYDLIGLPPTEEEVANFIGDKSDDAVAKLIDRFLESQHYGERWGRHWLDIARYADTSDYVNLTDPRYPYAFTYRDYVVRSFNEDKPYDRFLREQLAADQYVTENDAPELAALGFLTVGPKFRNNQPELISDRIDVVTRGLLGMTVGCARCHDHKYDPIPTTDYYALYGVFASCEEPEDLPIIDVGNPPPDEVADFEQQLSDRKKELNDFGEGLRQEAMAALPGRYAEHLDAYFQMNVARSASVRKLITGGKFKETTLSPLGRNLDRIGIEKKWKTDPIFGIWANVIRVPDAQFEQRLKQILTLANQPEIRKNINREVLALFSDSIPKNKQALLQRYGQLFDSIATQVTAIAARKTKSAKSKPTKRSSNEESVQAIVELLQREGGPFDLNRDQVVQASRLLGKGRRELANYENAIRDVESTHPGAPARAMVLVDKAAPFDPFVFIRGEPSRRGEKVPRRFLSILSNDEPQSFRDGSGRKELAEAITAPSNPLTARVMVNRVWKHHFGRGLVESTDDFGLQTSPPSHPELFDYLASSFIENRWSVKHLHRLILTSSTYQQQSDGNPKYSQKDPENKLYWRANRRRLDFESMRDSVLAVSGTLDFTIGGRPVELTDSPFPKRRTVYGFVNRMNLQNLFATFDFPSPDSSSSTRSETMVPQQALFVMNDPFMVDQVRRLASLPSLNDIDSPEEKIVGLYRRIFGRTPDDTEIQAGERFLALPSNSSALPTGTSWEYGYGPADLEGAGAAQFRPLTHWTGNAYQASDKFPDPDLGHIRVTGNGGHPGRDLDHAVIRRWTAPQNMKIRISGTASHLRDKGDGIRAQIIAGRKGVLGTWPLFNEQAATNRTYEVAQGESIDFVVDCRRHPTADSFTWTPVIREATPAKRGIPNKQWDARAEFSAPPPPPLTRWEQYCQALILTNEFLFVD